MRIITTIRVTEVIQAKASLRKIVAAVAAAPVVKQIAPRMHSTCHGLKPAIEQSMVNMFAVGRVVAAAGQFSADHGGDDVEHGQASSPRPAR